MKMKLVYIGIGMGVVTAGFFTKALNDWLRYGSDESFDAFLPVMWGRKGFGV